MEVLEHVNNPASFLSTCAELLKVRFVGPCIQLVDNLGYIARRPSFPFHNLPDSAFLFSHHPSCGEDITQSLPRHTHPLTVHQTLGTRFFLPKVSLTLQ